MAQLSMANADKKRFIEENAQLQVPAYFVRHKTCLNLFTVICFLVVEIVPDLKVDKKFVLENL